MRWPRWIRDLMSCRVIVKCGCSKKRRKVRPTLHLSDAVEQEQSVLKTPQYQGRIKKDFVLMETTITTTQKRTATVTQFTDRLGHVVPVQGVPAWVTDNSDVLALTVSDDGKSCTFASTGIPGSANVQMSVDGDTSDEVKLLVGTVSVTVVAAPAVNVDLQVGDAEEQ